MNWSGLDPEMGQCINVEPGALARTFAGNRNAPKAILRDDE